jgi:hypothetical protein
LPTLYGFDELFCWRFRIHIRAFQTTASPQPFANYNPSGDVVEQGRLCKVWGVLLCSGKDPEYTVGRPSM